jgi:glyoxylase-like metal-dependent hydrolase (beta-lactamase superfamily II)
MATRGEHYLGRAAELLDISVNQHDIVPPTLAVKQHTTLNLGNRELLLTAHPTAHTDNDLSIYDPKTDTLWLADLLFLEHAPVLDGSVKGWLTALTALEGNHYQRVIPGHGPVVTDWPAAMQPQKHYLQGLVDSIRPLIKQGKTLEYAVATVPVTGSTPWQLLDQFHRKNITQAFAELEWED